MISNDLLHRVIELEARTASMLPACERIFHLRTKELSHGGVTVILNQEKGTGLVTVGLSVCSSKDSFIKHKGVELAKENMYEFGVVYRTLQNIHKNQVPKMLTRLVETNQDPKLARQMLAASKLKLA